jgi:hypothetical protein
MSFISVLKKIGLDALKVAQVAAGLAPAVETFIPQTATVSRYENDFTAGINAIQVVEQMAGLLSPLDGNGNPIPMTGAQKLRAALPAIQTLLKQSEALQGKTLKDPAAFEAGSTQIVNGLVQVLNGYEASPAS